MTTTTIRRVLGALAAAAFLTGLALAGASADERSGPKFPLTRCEDLPHPFTAAHEINYDPDARTVTFVWEDGQQAMMRDTDRGCSSQPGLEAELRGNRDGWLDTQRASCKELRNLVDAVKAERRAQGKSTSGLVPVSDQAAEAAAMRNPLNAEQVTSGAVAAKNGTAGQRTIDLGRSDAVLASCPK